MAAALIDRLLHHCHIVNIRGNSYRMRAHPGSATRRGRGRRYPGRCHMSRFLRSGARCDLDFGRSAPCVQIATQSQHRREHTTERQGTSPEDCNFQLSKTCNFRLTLTANTANEYHSPSYLAPPRGISNSTLPEVSPVFQNSINFYRH